MKEYKTEYKDYSKYVAIMVSTDRSIFIEKSAVRSRMIEYSSLYKELHIIVLSTNKFETVEVSSKFTIHSTNSLLRWNYVTDAYKIGKDIIKDINKEISILVTCQNPFETALVGKRLANLRKDSELLLQIHTDLFSPYFKSHSILNKINLFIAGFTLPYAQVIRVVSRKIADSLVVRGYDPEKIMIKPIFVDVDYIKNTLPTFNLHEKYPNFKKIVLMVSRLETEKNIEMALYAIKMAKEKIPDLGLIIVGSGSLMQSLKRLAYRLKIDQNVAFIGWQTDLIPYYKGCDLFLFTSQYEGYGMVLKEAEAAGCKIVSTDVGIAREVGATIVDWKAQDIADKLVETIK